MSPPLMAQTHPEKPLRFTIPAHLRGSAADYLARFRTKNLKRALSEPERSELKKLFIWAEEYDRKRHLAVNFSADCSLTLLLFKEFPVVRTLRLEVDYIIDEFLVAMTLKNSLNEAQARVLFAHRMHEMSPNHFPQRPIPNYLLPTSPPADDLNFDEYLNTYPIAHPNKTLTQIEKTALIEFFKAIVENCRSRGIPFVLIRNTSPIYKAIIFNFPSLSSVPALTPYDREVEKLLAALRRQ